MNHGESKRSNRPITSVGKRVFTEYFSAKPISRSISISLFATNAGFWNQQRLTFQWSLFSVNEGDSEDGDQYSSGVESF